MTKYYALFNKELDAVVFPIDRLLTKEEAEKELERQEHDGELEIREVDPPAEES